MCSNNQPVFLGQQYLLSSDWVLKRDHRKEEVIYWQGAEVLQTGSWTQNLEVPRWSILIGYTLEFECPLSSILQALISFPFRSKTPSGSVNPNIKMAYEYTRSLTGVALFSRIPLGVQKTLLHGGGVTSCGTYSHQSGPQAIPPTVSSADPLCWGSRWVRFRWLFPLDTEHKGIILVCILWNSSRNHH